MSISQLSLTDFRNLQSATLDFHSAINLISGNNGSGKTSLLEAIFVLCQAHSFRNHQLKKAIQHSKNNFLLFGRFTDYKAGLSKSDKKLEIRIDGENVKRRSIIVSKTPISIVNANSFNLIIGSPEERRKYVDWCLFHVEPGYAENWLKFRHALKQRNQLLKTRKDLSLLDYWNGYLVEPSLVLQELRVSICKKITVFLREEMSNLLADMLITIAYKQGWDEDLSLLQSLENNRERDIRSGFTNAGIHRDNLTILADGKSAAEVLSRGQLKRLSLGLIVASLRLVSSESERPIILLIDDLHAEMDEVALQKVYQELLSINLQLFITNIDNRIPEYLRGKDFKMFHVEHGKISVRKPSQ